MAHRPTRACRPLCKSLLLYWYIIVCGCFPATLAEPSQGPRNPNYSLWLCAGRVRSPRFSRSLPFVRTLQFAKHFAGPPSDPVMSPGEDHRGHEQTFLSGRVPGAELCPAFHTHFLTAAFEITVLTLQVPQRKLREVKPRARGRP